MGSKKQQTKEFARNILLYLIYHFQEEWKGIAADAEVQEFNKHTHNFLAAFQKLTGIQIDRTNPDWFCMKEPPTLRDYRISAAKGVVGYTPYLNAVSVLETCLSKLDQGKITLYQLTAENSNSGPEADSGFQFIGDGDAAAVKITENEKKILSCLAEHPDLIQSQADIEAGVYLSRKTIRRLLQSLQQKGLIEKHPRGVAITPKGVELAR